MLKTRTHKRTDIPLKIRGAKLDCDGGIFRYEFRITPLVQGSGVFLFMRYCLACDLLDPECRKLIARDLRKKHHEAWQRYHAWREAHGT